MRKLLIFCILGSCGLPPKTTDESSQVAPSAPNVILLMADDLGWGDVGYQGNDSVQTPHIDQMAQEGVVLNRFYSASSVCSPTRGSCLTGRHPQRYGIVTANAGHMPPEEVTMAEILQQRGYATGHFGKWHLGTLSRDTLDSNRGGRPQHRAHYSPPWDNGFDVCFSTEAKVPTWDPMITPEKAAGGVNKEPGSFYGTRYWNELGLPETENLGGDNSRVIMDRALQFVETSITNEKPFLAVIWFHTPHTPVVGGAPYRELYRDNTAETQHYYGSITAMDEQIGRLMQLLKGKGVHENTLTFFTSDNGPELRRISPRGIGQTLGLRGRKRSLYEGGIRVPGVIVFPQGVSAGSASDIPFFTSDYLPTVLDVIGEPSTPIANFDGSSMLPYLDQSAEAEERQLAFTFGKQEALIGVQYKLYTSEGTDYELYDIAADPGESVDLAPQQPEKLRAMQAYLADWRDAVRKDAQRFE